MTIKFLRNKVVEVEPQKDGTLLVSWRLTDDLLKLEVNLVVMPPDLEILEANARVDRFPPKGCENAGKLVEKIESCGYQEIDFAAMRYVKKWKFSALDANSPQNDHEQIIPLKFKVR